MKREFYWIGLLTSFWAIIVLAPDFFGWQAISGFTSVVIRFFLGYCAIILVAQVFAALVAVRDLMEEAATKKVLSQRVLVRSEQPTIAPEE